MTEFKNLPYFDPRHVDYAPQHNATSEAVIQLQKLVHQLLEEVEELKGSKTSGRSTARKTTGS